MQGFTRQQHALQVAVLVMKPQPEADGEAVPGERAVGQALLERAGLDRLVAVWENCTQLFAQADGLNLDRKQAVLSAFLALGADARR